MDIEKLLEEAVTKPSDDALAAAPFLDGWWIIQAGHFLRARGQVEGHPSIDDPYVTTRAFHLLTEPYPAFSR